MNAPANRTSRPPLASWLPFCGLVLAACVSTPSGRSPGDRYVVAAGHGRSEREATDAALYAAVERALGATVLAEVELAAGTIRERILTRSAGYVRRFDVLRSELEGDEHWHVRIGAVVRQTQLARDVSDVTPASSTVVKDGSDWRAEAVTRERAERQGALFLEEILSDVDETLLSVKFDQALRPIAPDARRGEFTRDGYTWLGCSFSTQVDAAEHARRFVTPLRALLADSARASALWPARTLGTTGAESFRANGMELREVNLWHRTPRSAIADPNVNPLFLLFRGGRGDIFAEVYDLPSRYRRVLAEGAFPGRRSLGVRLRLVSENGRVLAEDMRPLNKPADFGISAAWAVDRSASAHPADRHWTATRVDPVPLHEAKASMRDYFAVVGGDTLVLTNNSARVYVPVTMSHEWRLQIPTDALLEASRLDAQVLLMDTH